MCSFLCTCLLLFPCRFTSTGMTIDFVTNKKTFKSIQDLKNTFQIPNMYDFGFILLWEMWKVLFTSKQNKKLHFWRRSFDLFRQDFFNCFTIIVLSLLKWTLFDTNLIKRLKTYTLLTPSPLFLHISVWYTLYRSDSNQTN